VSASDEPEPIAEPAPKAAEGPGLFDRLREFLGLGPASVRDDIEDALESPAPDAGLTPHERTLLRNVLKLHDVRVKDVMVPRADVVSLPIDASVDEALKTFRAASHSRLPVYHDTLDDPRGMVHLRDFVEFLGDAASPADRAKPLSAAGVLRPVLYAPPSMPALDLLVKMQTSRTHMALVVDEYGGTDGLVSIEDLVEEIVGDIEDEHDDDEAALIAAGADGTFSVEARAALDEVSRAVRFDFAGAAEGDDVDTIGGLVVARAGRVPSRGEILSGPGDFEFEILDADPRRVKRIRIRPTPARARKLATPPRREHDATADQNDG